jgi:hypothetical protein
MCSDIEHMNKYCDFAYDQNKNFDGLPDHVLKRLHSELIWNHQIIENNTKYKAYKEGFIYIKRLKDIPISERHNPTDVPTDIHIIYGRMCAKRFFCLS